jgi:hypothetical protein
VIVAGSLAIVARGIERDSVAARDAAASVSSLIDRSDFDAASDVLTSARRRSPRDSNLARLESELQRRIALDRLLQQLEDRPECQVPETLAERIESVARENYEETLFALANSALALAEFFRDDLVRARRHIAMNEAAGRPTRSSTMLLGLLDDRKIERTELPNAVSADDHVLTAMVMRCGRYSIDERRDEIDRAFAIDKTNYRVSKARVPDSKASVAAFDNTPASTGSLRKSASSPAILPRQEPLSVASPRTNSVRSNVGWRSHSISWNPAQPTFRRVAERSRRR